MIFRDKPINDRAGADQRACLDLLALAHAAKELAYAPYSSYRVGAALRAKDGSVIAAANVENRSYGLTICAERAAIAKAVSQGFRPGDFEMIAIAASAEDFSPCGACREVINEFGADMIVVFEYEDEVVITRLNELLAFAVKR